MGKRIPSYHNQQNKKISWTSSKIKTFGVQRILLTKRSKPAHEEKMFASHISYKGTYIQLLLGKWLSH